MDNESERGGPRDPYERLLAWARAFDLDAAESAAARLMPLPELESEWSAGPALRVGPLARWANCRRIIRALDAELIEIDARAELRQIESDGESAAEAGERAERLEAALIALRALREAPRLDALWDAARRELMSRPDEFRDWVGHDGRSGPRQRSSWGVEAGLEDRFGSVAELPESPWPRARAAAGWILDGLRADPERAAEALSALEKEELGALASGRGEARGGRL